MYFVQNRSDNIFHVKFGANGITAYLEESKTNSLKFSRDEIRRDDASRSQSSRELNVMIIELFFIFIYYNYF